MYEVVWPGGQKNIEQGRFAQRLKALNGKTIGNDRTGLSLVIRFLR